MSPSPTSTGTFPNDHNLSTLKLFTILAAAFLLATAAATTFAAETVGAPTEEKPTTIEDRIRAAFPEAPEAMVSIARCESTLRQFEPDGVTPLAGRKSPDIGLFQINIVHWEEAKKLGIDIYSEEGNIAYARRLFEANGFRDWYSSNHCHGLLG